MKAFLSIVQMSSTACSFLLQLTKIRAVENAEVIEYKAEYVSDADGHWCVHCSMNRCTNTFCNPKFLPRYTMWREIDGLRLLLVLVKQASALCTISKRSIECSSRESVPQSLLVCKSISILLLSTDIGVANLASGPQLHISPTHVPSQLSTDFDG
ncbi:hypothetical protein T01_15697 [Trichinella spiralis]|uniref:Uncharacterized protein n=1 Tax=Trichinella spiralis TaxID=6334 RepID=A0A0V1BGY5_TRISP|nr:hypothetical protein T01_15697 [Trichinella spiralis]